MTPAHFVFIPTVFMLGFLLGGLLAGRSPAAPQTRAINPIEGKPARVSPALLGAALLLFAGVFVATHVLPMPGGVKALHHAMGGAPIFDQQPSFSSAAVQQRLGDFGELGRALYQRFTYSVDVIFPLSLLAFLSLLARFVAQRRSLSARHALSMQILPLLWFAADMVENASIFSLLTLFPAESVGLGQTLAWVTVTKFALLLLSSMTPALVAVLGKRVDAARLSDLTQTPALPH